MNNAIIQDNGLTTSVKNDELLGLQKNDSSYNRYSTWNLSHPHPFVLTGEIDQVH